MALRRLLTKLLVICLLFLAISKLDVKQVQATDCGVCTSTDQGIYGCLNGGDEGCVPLDDGCRMTGPCNSRF